MFKIFQPFIDFFTNIFGGHTKDAAPAPIDTGALLAQRDAETQAANQAKQEQIAAQTGGGKLVNPFTGYLGVGDDKQQPIKSLF